MMNDSETDYDDVSETDDNDDSETDDEDELKWNWRRWWMTVKLTTMMNDREADNDEEWQKLTTMRNDRSWRRWWMTENDNDD